MNISGMGALVISVYKKIWCGTIRGCGTINIISRNKDKNPSNSTVVRHKSSKYDIHYYESKQLYLDRYCSMCNLVLIRVLKSLCRVSVGIDIYCT